MLDSGRAALYGVPAATPPSARSRASDPAPLRRGLRTRKRGACLCSSGCHTVLAVKAVCSSRLRRSCLQPLPQATACARRALPQGSARRLRAYPILVGAIVLATIEQGVMPSRSCASGWLRCFIGWTTGVFSFCRVETLSNSHSLADRPRLSWQVRSTRIKRSLRLRLASPPDPVVLAVIARPAPKRTVFRIDENRVDRA